ncbi:MAG: hypothetical protein AB7V43_17240 [Acidimicrobiia bacterium]
METDGRVEAIRKAFPVRAVVVPFIVSRIIAIGAVASGGTNKGHVSFGGLTYWDSVWYLNIASAGYGPPPIDGEQSPWPFFPLYPAMVRALHEVGVPYQAAMVLISNGFLLIGLAGLWRIASWVVPGRAAHLTVWSCALFPFAVVFSMGYVSSIVLATTTWAWIWVEDRRDAWAACALLVLVASRPNGFLFGFVLLIAVYALERRADRTNAAAATARRVTVLAVPSLLFVAVWCALCWRWTDDPLVFLTAKDAWDESTIATLFHPENAAKPHLMAAAVSVVVIAWWGRRWTTATMGWVVLSIGPPLVLGIVGLGRYINETFPVFVAAGAFLARLPRVLSYLALTGSVIAMVVFANAMVRYRYLP